MGGSLRRRCGDLRGSERRIATAGWSLCQAETEEGPRKSRSSSTAAAIFRRDHRAPRPARGEFAKAGNAEAEGTALCTLMTAFGTGGPPPKKSRVITATYGKKWRRRRDSNPRYPLQGTTI